MLSPLHMGIHSEREEILRQEQISSLESTYYYLISDKAWCIGGQRESPQVCVTPVKLTENLSSVSMPLNTLVSTKTFYHKLWATFFNFIFHHCYLFSEVSSFMLTP